MSGPQVSYSPLSSRYIDGKASPFSSAVQSSAGDTGQMAKALAGLSNYNPRNIDLSDLQVYTDVAKIQENEVPKDLAAFTTAEANYNAVKNNPKSTQGEIIKATNEYNNAKHVYELSKTLSANSKRAAEEAKAESETMIKQASSRKDELSGLLSGRIKETRNNISSPQIKESGFTITA